MRLMIAVIMLIWTLSVAAVSAQQNAQASQQKGADETERQDQTVQEAIRAAQKATESWLSLVDAGKFAEAWDQSSEGLKAIVTKEQLVGSLKIARNSMGSLLKRKVNSAGYTTTLNNAPTGEYVVLKYDCSFENKEKALETVVPTLDKDGKWRVSGYFVK